MKSEFGLTKRQYGALCNAELRSIVNYYKYGGGEVAEKLLNYRLSRKSKQINLDVECDSQD